MNLRQPIRGKLLIQDADGNVISMLIHTLNNMTIATDEFCNTLRTVTMAFETGDITLQQAESESEQDIPSELWEEMILNGVQDGQ